MKDQTRQSAGWQVEQSASKAYEQFLVPAIFSQWTERLIETSEMQPGDTVLDIACGTGIVARRAATRVGTNGSVAGLDINERMLAVAKECAAGIQPPIEWHHGDAAHLPFAEDEFDAICCQQALQFFGDPASVIEEMKRVLRLDGRVTLSVWRPLSYQPAYVVLADALAQYISEDAGEMMGSPFPAWDSEDLRTLLQGAGFEDVLVTVEIASVRYPSVAEFIRREAASSPLAEPIANVAQEVRDELIHAVEGDLHPYIDDGGIVSPMESYVIVAER